MHSIRIQLLAFIMAVLLIFLIILNIYPITSARDLIFEEKKSALAGQAAVVASSLSGLDRLSPESVREVLQLLDLGGYSRTMIAGADGTVVYDDTAAAGGPTDNLDVLSSLGGKCVFRSRFSARVFSSSYAMPIFSRGATVGAVYLLRGSTLSAKADHLRHPDPADALFRGHRRGGAAVRGAVLHGAAEPHARAGPLDPYRGGRGLRPPARNTRP